MTEKFYDANDVKDIYMEVSIHDDDAIYWVDITDIDSSIDPYDYAIEKAVKYHNVKYDEVVSDENAFASEPFSRYESEFTYVK